MAALAGRNVLCTLRGLVVKQDDSSSTRAALEVPAQHSAVREALQSACAGTAELQSVCTDKRLQAPCGATMLKWALWRRCWLAALPAGLIGITFYAFQGMKPTCW